MTYVNGVTQVMAAQLISMGVTQGSAREFNSSHSQNGSVDTTDDTQSQTRVTTRLTRHRYRRHRTQTRDDSSWTTDRRQMTDATRRTTHDTRHTHSPVQSDVRAPFDPHDKLGIS